MKHHNWYSSSFPCDGTPYLDFLRSGALYVSGRCKRGHQPVIVINIKKFIEQKKTVTQLQEISTYFFDWVERYMLVKGHVESWFLIIDCKDVSVSQVPVTSLQGFIVSLQKNFRGRMFRLVAINSPLLLKAAWAIVYSWLDEFVQQKLIICGSKSLAKNLLEYIDDSQLEMKFGGKLPNITNRFFPPLPLNYGKQ